MTPWGQTWAPSNTAPLPDLHHREQVRVDGHRVPYAANRAVALMSRMYAMAADWEMVPDGTDPCRSVRKYPVRGRERFLTDTEFRRLGEAPTEGGVSVHAVAAIRLLMLTGCRKTEILSLQWTDIDLEASELRLRESKTGPRAVPLSRPAAKVLSELPRVPGNPWVIPVDFCGAGGQLPLGRRTRCR